ncbi:MAG: hypothetical protein LBI92_04965 [Azoarcus sp.]|nr:hypothetical protein [Azoarcus sp.]
MILPEKPLFYALNRRNPFIEAGCIDLRFSRMRIARMCLSQYKIMKVNLYFDNKEEQYMKFKYEFSSASISDIMNFIQQEAGKIGKNGPSGLGASLSLLIALRLCALMDVRTRVRRAWQEAESIAPDLVRAKDEVDFDQLRAKTWVMCTRLSVVLGSIDGDIDSLCDAAEKLVVALSAKEQGVTGRKFVPEAIALLNILIGAVRDELPEQDSVVITDEARDLIERIAVSSKETGGIAELFRGDFRSEYERMKDSLSLLENSVERVKEASRAEEKARRETEQKEVSAHSEMTPIAVVADVATNVAANDEVIPQAGEAVAYSASRPAAPPRSVQNIRSLASTIAQQAQPQPQSQPQPAQTTPLAEAAASLRSLVQKLRQSAGNIRC